MDVDNNKVEIIRSQYPIVREFINHYVVYKELQNIEQSYFEKSLLWISNNNANLTYAVICWCKVFASPKNEIHFSKINNEFNSRAIKELEITEKEYLMYVGQMQKFRNKYIAHTDIEFSQPVPFLERAYQIALIYDIWIREIIYPDIIACEDLESYSNEVRKQIRDEIYNIAIKT